MIACRIEPPAKKFKTIPDEGAPELDNLNVLHANEKLMFWDDKERMLWTNTSRAGIYQWRQPIGNGYVGGQVTGAGPFFELDVNQTNHGGIVEEGWPEGGRRQTFWTAAGYYDVQPTTKRTNFEEIQKLGYVNLFSF
jgi:hypothetical protein